MRTPIFCKGVAAIPIARAALPAFAAFALGSAFTVHAHAQGTVAGRVRELSGPGVAGAQVRLSDSSASATTDAGGAFRLRSLKPGRIEIVVRRVGFRPATRTVDVVDGATIDVIIPVEPIPEQLALVTVRERRVVDGFLSGFHERLANASSASGKFVTREKIDASPSSMVTDFLRGIAGVQVIALRGLNMRNTIRLRGSRCPPTVFIDGFPASMVEFDVDAIKATTLEGIEVYTGMGGVPAELMGSLDQYKCGVIALWTRSVHANPRRKSPKKQSQLAAERKQLDALSPVYAATEVDSVARVDSSTFVPAYPASLWSAGTRGVVRVEFVVDTTGTAAMQYFTVISTTAAEFSESVREAVEGARFSPATKDGKSVRQLVHLPVEFARDSTTAGRRRQKN